MTGDRYLLLLQMVLSVKGCLLGNPPLERPSNGSSRLVENLPPENPPSPCSAPPASCPWRNHER